MTERILRDTGSLMYGDFTLSSGKKSEYFFWSERYTLTAQGAVYCVPILVAKLDELQIFYVGGTDHGGIPLVAQIAMYSGLRHGPPIRAFYHKEKYVRSKKAVVPVEGLPPLFREPVAIVDDAVTTGASMLYAIRRAEEDGMNVTHGIALLDRDEGGREAVEEAGYDFWAVYRVERENGEIRFALNC